jgi:hypothetical protein
VSCMPSTETTIFFALQSVGGGAFIFHSGIITLATGIAR